MIPSNRMLSQLAEPPSKLDRSSMRLPPGIAPSFRGNRKLGDKIDQVAKTLQEDLRADLQQQLDEVKRQVSSLQSTASHRPAKKKSGSGGEQRAMGTARPQGAARKPSLEERLKRETANSKRVYEQRLEEEFRGTLDQRLALIDEIKSPVITEKTKRHLRRQQINAFYSTINLEVLRHEREFEVDEAKLAELEADRAARERELRRKERRWLEAKETTAAVLKKLHERGTSAGDRSSAGRLASITEQPASQSTFVTQPEFRPAQDSSVSSAASHKR